VTPCPEFAEHPPSYFEVTERRQVRVTGTVQGVGFRPFVYRVATELGLAGWVANDSAGVVMEIDGPPDALDELCRRLSQEPPPLARVSSVTASALPLSGPRHGFRIVTSRSAGPPAVGVSVDVATCADCLREMYDPSDRRFGYPFINCTNCGPRYTIIRRIPYDRPFTTMADFVMCEDCQREYTDPTDRRFHAEPNACDLCGPHLALLAPDGTPSATRAAALAGAVELLRSGRILAVKGLGGYHLAADANQAEAVGELRRRKARDDKPFALMVNDLAAARRLCHLSPAGEEALASPGRPIVLAPRRADATVADGVAPGLPELGLMLPYTPLHHLLADGVGGQLVMTSGNLSDEPIAHADDDAVGRLGPMVDAILTHDRAIHIRCDDSVVRAHHDRSGGWNGAKTARFGRQNDGAGVPALQMIRRSRGYAPQPLTLPAPCHRQVLAVGAELKNTVAVAKRSSVVASHHIGDLEHLAAYQSFLQAVDHLCRITGVEPDVIAHDLHPEYLSTKFALDRDDLPTHAVQHHHAHIASCLVDNQFAGAVLGIAFDGLGMGSDGTAWGGEFLVADLGGFRRVGHLRAVPLPGGNQAIREPWRMAMTWAAEAGGRAEGERYGRGADERWPAVMRLSEAPNTLLTSSAGRLFDAVAALLGVRKTVTYEGQAAIELEASAASVDYEDIPSAPTMDLVSDGSGMVVVDPSALVAWVIAQRDQGIPVPLISAGFHLAFGRGAADVAITLARIEGLETVALSGGVFQNALLTRVVASSVHSAGLRVLVHHQIPPNDGGVSIGQAAIAATGAD